MCLHCSQQCRVELKLRVPGPGTESDLGLLTCSSTSRFPLPPASDIIFKLRLYKRKETKAQTPLFFGNTASEKKVKTETETGPRNDLSPFEKQITKEKLSLQEAKTLQNNLICYANCTPKTIIILK